MWTKSGSETRETLQPGEKIPMSHAKSTERIVQAIRRKTRRRFSAEEKIRIILEGLRGEESIVPLCRREGLNPNLYYRGARSFSTRLAKVSGQQPGRRQRPAELRSPSPVLRLKRADA